MKTFLKIILGVSSGLGFVLASAAIASAATLSLLPSSQNLNVGDTVTVSVNLDTAGASIDGVDLKYINYNPYYLQLQDVDSVTAGTQIQAGSLMPNTLANSADTTNGKISFSQVTAGGTTYKGSGVLATLTFKALVAGNATIGIDFTPGATTDSNVASSGTDILSAVTNGQYVISNPNGSTNGNSGGSGNTGGSNTGGQGSGGSGSGLRLINDKGTYYLIMDNMRLGITNPGMLYTYGFTFAMGKPATADDLALPAGALLTPNDGALVKSKEDPTVYLISGQKRYSFVSADVFTKLGFKFSSVLIVTNPELQALAKADNLSDGNAGHLPGLDINRNGTVYWVGPDGQLHGYPSLQVYNSWHLPNDFSRAVPANAADMSLQIGDLVTQRILQ